MLKLSATTGGVMRIDEQTTKRATQAIDPSSRAWLCPGDILVQRANSLEYLGATAIYDGAPGGAIYPDLMMRIRTADEVTGRYVWRWLNAESARAYFRANATGTAGNMPKINGEVLRRTPLPLPPLNEQRRIVAKIAALAERSRRAKEALEAVPPLLDKLRQSILAAAFRGDLTADWRRRRGLGSGVPAWNQSTVASVCEVIVDCPHSTPKWTELGEVCLRTTNFFVSGLDLSEMCFVSAQTFRERTARLEPMADDVVYSREGGILGIACVIPAGLKACLGQRMMLLRCSAAVRSEFLCYWLNSPATVDRVRGLTGGSASPHLNVRDVKQFPVPCPTLEEQEEIIARLHRSFGMLERAREQVASGVASLERMNQSVSAKAFRGDLVPQDPRDEPASVLLERIRVAREGGHGDANATRRKKRVEAADERESEDVESEDAAREPEDGSRMIILRSSLDEYGGDGWLHKSRERRRQTTGDVTPFNALEDAERHAAVFDALWSRGSIEKDAAVRALAEQLRDAGRASYQRLRADGPLYADVLSAIESAVKAGVLDRPCRGHVRAIKDAQAMTPEDWRHALVASLGEEPMLRDQAIRTAAEWARDHLGVTFERLRADGLIVSALRSAINSTIRRGEVVRHGADQIARAPAGGDDVASADDASDDDAHEASPGRLWIIVRHLKPRLVDAAKPVLALQFDGKGSALELEHLAVMVLAGALSFANDKPKGTGWTFFLGVDRPHVDGLSTWLGVGSGVPGAVVDLLQQLLEGAKHRVRREYAVPLQHDLAPIVVATDEEIEVSDSGPDNEFLKEHFDEDAKVVRRAFVVDAKHGKAAKLTNLFFGPSSDA